MRFGPMSRHPACGGSCRASLRAQTGRRNHCQALGRLAPTPDNCFAHCQPQRPLYRAARCPGLWGGRYVTYHVAPLMAERQSRSMDRQPYCYSDHDTTNATAIAGYRVKKSALRIMPNRIVPRQCVFEHGQIFICQKNVITCFCCSSRWLTSLHLSA